jgi:uncharacterized protein (DUF2267 family)
MDYDRFVNLVTQGRRDRPRVRRTTMQATLETLAQRISAGEARDLASQLAAWLNATQRSQRFDVDEFIWGSLAIDVGEVRVVRVVAAA